MTSTPSVRGAPEHRQAPRAPDRMRHVEDWRTPGNIGIELYADPAAGDGYVIAFGPYGAEHAADLTDVTADPRVTWMGHWAHRSEDWRAPLETRIRAELKAWAS